MSITNQQLAELIVGFAKSQNAIIDSIVHHVGQDGKTFRGRSVVATLQDYAHVINHAAQPTLQDLPSRVWLKLQAAPRGGQQPIEQWLAQELDRLVP